MAKNAKWDIEEAAILLEGLIEIYNEKKSRRAVIERISKELRNRALFSGSEVTQTFRNHNGVALQMSILEYVFTDGKNGLKKTAVSKVFRDVVDIYRNRRNCFEQVLLMARQKENNANSRDDFFGWLSGKVSPAQLSELYNTYSEIEGIAKEFYIVQQSLFEDLGTKYIDSCINDIQRNKMFQRLFRRHEGRFTSAINYLREYAIQRECLEDDVKKKSGESEVEDAVDPTMNDSLEEKTKHIEEKSEGYVSKNADVKDTRELGKLQVDFQNIKELSFTKPVDYSYFDEKQEQVNSWRRLYASVVNCLLEDYPDVFMQYLNKNIEGKKALDFSDNDRKNQLRSPLMINGNFFLETNFCATNIANRIKMLLEICNVDYENVVIHYQKVGETREQFVEGDDAKDNMKDVPAISESSTNTTNKERFEKWLREKRMEESVVSEYVTAMGQVSVIARQYRLINCSLFSIRDSDEIRNIMKELSTRTFYKSINEQYGNRFRKALRKYECYLECNDKTSNSNPIIEIPVRNEKYVAVLKEKFANGFRMNSPIEIRKFRAYYFKRNGSELQDSDEVMIKSIRKECLLYKEKAYLMDIIMSEQLKESILSFIKENFANGKQVIYFKALYNQFSKELLDSKICNADMLGQYLLHLELKNVWLNKNYISQSANVVIDPVVEIRNCLQEHARPMDYQEVFSVLPHLPQETIKRILSSKDEFVKNESGSYFHVTSIILSDEELEKIAALIEHSIDEKEFVGGNELYVAIKAKYPSIIENNNFCSVYGFRDALKYKLGNRFSFKGNIISREGQSLSMADVFANFAKKHDDFSLTELQSLANELATIIYFDSIYENSLRISKEQFVSKSQARFAVAETDAAIDRICTDNYISIREITNFGVFPYAGFPWNSFLLEHFTAEYSQKYMLLHSNYNGTECAGAIVKKNAGIHTFDELIVDFLANSNIELNKASALQLLSDEGYLARRRYSSIESLIIQANALRNRKDTD